MTRTATLTNPAASTVATTNYISMTPSQITTTRFSANRVADDYAGPHWQVHWGLGTDYQEAK